MPPQQVLPPENQGVVTEIKKRNFWAYYPLILILANAAFLVPVLLRSSELELMGIPVLINLYIIFVALPVAIALIIWPYKTFKKICAMLASLIFLPILFAFAFIHVGIPILSQEYQEKKVELAADINGKNFIPIAVNKSNVVLPGNIIIQVQEINTTGMSDAFEQLFKKEVIDKKREVAVVLGPNPYIISTIGDPTKPWLIDGQEYKLIRGNLSLNDEVIDKNFITQEGGNIPTETMTGYFMKKSDDPAIATTAADYYFLQSNSSNGKPIKVIIETSAKCFDPNGQRIGCYADLYETKAKYPGKSVVRYFIKDGNYYVTEVRFQF